MKNKKNELQSENANSFNQNVFNLIENMKKTTVIINYIPQGSDTIRTVRATLIGYWYEFKRPFIYIPRLTFLPYWDMDARAWRTIQITGIIF